MHRYFRGLPRESKRPAQLARRLRCCALVAGLLFLMPVPGLGYSEEDTTLVALDTLPIEAGYQSAPPPREETEAGEGDAPWKLTFELGPSYDIVNAYGEHTFTQLSGDSLQCLTAVTRDRGHGRNVGYMGGIKYGPFGFRGRYTDLSGTYDTISYEFRTLGLEVSVSPLMFISSWRESALSNFFDASISANLDARINTFREGLGSNLVAVDGARGFMPRFGAVAGLHANILGVDFGPEIQYKWSPFDLVPGDAWSLTSIAAVFGIKLGNTSSAPPAPAATAPRNFVFITSPVLDATVYLIEEWQFNAAAGQAVSTFVSQCFSESSLSTLWASGRHQTLGKGSVTTLIPYGKYRVFAVARDAKDGCRKYSEPIFIDFTSSSQAVYQFMFDKQKCGCQ